MLRHLRKLIYPTGTIDKQKYTKYVSWSFFSNVLVSTESALATHSMLYAIDFGTETIRTANYIGKDVIGQIGGLAYMSQMGTKSDKEPRKFLMYSNILQQLSYTVVCTTPFMPNYFLPIAGIANVLSNIAFTGFGSINARCIRDLAEDDNIGEIYAKVSMVNTIGSSLGLMIGVLITAYVPDHYSRMLLIPAIATLRIYTYNKAIEELMQ